MSDSVSYSVNPKEEVTVKTISSISCQIFSLVLGQRATINTLFKDVNGYVVKSVIDVIEGEDYTNWGSDDMYIPNWVCQKYGLTLSS